MHAQITPNGNTRQRAIRRGLLRLQRGQPAHRKRQPSRQVLRGRLERRVEASNPIRLSNNDSGKVISDDQSLVLTAVGLALSYQFFSTTFRSLNVEKS